MLGRISTLGGLRSSCIAAIFAFGISAADAATLNPEVGNEFFGNDLNWLMNPSLLPSGVNSDAGALAELGRLFQTGDEKAPLALQNYIKRYPNDPAAFDLAGVVLMQEGNYDQAVLSFRKGIGLNPGSAWLWAKLGAALVLAGDGEQAKKQFAQALKIDPNNPLALRHMAQFAVQEDDLIIATQHSERALRAFGMPFGTVNQAHFDLAELYQRMNRHGAGLELLRGAVNNPELDIPEARKLELFGRYLDLAMQLGNSGQARVAYDKLKPLVDLNDPRVRLTEARLLRMEGDFIGSIGLIEAISSMHEEMAPQLLPDKAITLAASGQHIAAAGIWRDLAATAEEGSDLQYLREALLAMVNGEQKDAVAAEVQSLSAANPDRVDIALLELEFLGKTGRTSTALERATAMAAIFPDDAEIHRMLGIISAAEGDKSAGRMALERSLEINPKQPRTWLTLAGVVHGHGSYVGTGHSANGSHADVEALLKNAIAANPSSSDLYAELGLMYLSDGRVDEAISSFDGAIANNPTHMAGLSLGALARADANVDLPAALAMIDRARVMSPDDAINKDIMGWVLSRQGQTEPGLELLEEAASQAPADVTIQYHLGVTKEAMGDADGARGHYLAALGGANYDHNVTDTRDRYVSLAGSAPITIDLERIDDGFEGTPIGTIMLDSSDNGVSFKAEMTALAPGPYAAHVHEYANCGAGSGEPGSLAGGHYGHDAHSGHDMASMGDNGMQPGDMSAMPKENMASMGDKDAAGNDGMMNHGAMSSGKDGSDTMAGMNMTGIESQSEGDEATGMPKMAMKMPPRGDLPPFVFDANGTSATMVMSDALTLDEIRGRSIMLHLGEDKDGKSGPKVACGIIR